METDSWEVTVDGSEQTVENCLAEDLMFCYMADYTGVDYPINTEDFTGPVYLRCDQGNRQRYSIPSNLFPVTVILPTFIPITVLIISVSAISCNGELGLILHRVIMIFQNAVIRNIYIHDVDCFAMGMEQETFEGGDFVSSGTSSESQDTELESTQTGAEGSNDAWNPWWIIVIGIMVIVIGAGVFFVVKKREGKRKRVELCNQKRVFSFR